MGQASGTITIPNSTLESYGGANISLMKGFSRVELVVLKEILDTNILVRGIQMV